MALTASRTTAALLAGLDPAQLEAVEVTRGPLCILAGAGSGKTRVISRRVAYAIATDAIQPRQALVVTFTDKAATEMRERIAGLGQPEVASGTFHATAFKQLRFFWPLLSDLPLPQVAASKLPLIAPLQQRLPGGYRFFPARDLAQEVEWAKARRLTPRTYTAGAAAAGHEGPLPPELMADLFRRYEEAKSRAGQIDFEDMLAMTVELLEGHPDALAQVRSRHRWLSVDEYQDTTALQESLLRLWLGDRDDLAVVGDVDQTIYSFTGASSEFLTGFGMRFPDARVVYLERNYRSTPQVLAVANRLLAGAPALHGRAKQLIPTLSGGPLPSIRSFPDAGSEAAAVIGEARRLREEGVAPAEMAILVRTNAQLPEYEDGMRAAGLAFQVGGERFFERPEVRSAMRAVQAAARRSARTQTREDEGSLSASLLRIWEEELGFEPDDEPEAEGLRQRHASLVALLGLAGQLETAAPDADLTRFVADIEARSAAESDDAAATGIALLTFHRAKGLEWDAVFLPALEEGLLPIRRSAEPAEVEEERRLLYVGITRARRHLWLSWAHRRAGNQGREVARRSSRFLVALQRSGPVAAGDGHRSAAGRPRRNVAEDGSSADSNAAQRAATPRTTASEGLRAWRTQRARADRMPPYVILHDATLEAIVEARPGTLADLGLVKGMGPTRLERYGEEILFALGRDARAS